MKNKKKKGTLIIWISLFVLITCIVLFVIGCNSSLLINKYLKYFFGILGIINIIILLYGIRLVIKGKRRRNYKRGKKWFLNIIISIYVIGCCGFLFLLYGPYDSFREWLITTAMGTMNHQYLCRWFYSDEYINDYLNSNYVDDGGAETDPSLINHKKTTKYANEYERAVLERDEDALYKVIDLEVNGCTAYLGVVYDASKISVGYSKWLGRSGQYIYDMAKEQGAVLAINGGGFYDPGSNSNGANPTGVTISNRKVITNHYGKGIIGFNNDDTLVLIQSGDAYDLVNKGIRDAVTMGPFLVVNGKSSYIQGNGGWGYAARTAIGQRADGIVLFLVVDSNGVRTKGATMKDLADIMIQYGAINAANLDGGTSSVMVVEGEMINDPIDSALRHRTRGIPTIFKVVP